MGLTCIDSDSNTFFKTWGNNDGNWTDEVFDDIKERLLTEGGENNIVVIFLKSILIF